MPLVKTVPLVNTVSTSIYLLQCVQLCIEAERSFFFCLCEDSVIIQKAWNPIQLVSGALF